MNFIVIALLLAVSALFSGLTIGLMSLDLPTLKRKIAQGSDEASAVLAIRKNGMQLLVTLLLGNAAANSALSIMLGEAFSGLVAGLMSTVLIFAFGEVIPQAVLSRHALAFGARSAWFTRTLMFVAYPIAAPFAHVLNKVLGEEAGEVYTKKDILSIIEDETETGTDHSAMRDDERRLVRGSLSFSHKMVRDVMTPHTIVTTVHLNDEINRRYLQELIDIDYSRIPVQGDDTNDIVGILMLKDMVGKELPVMVKDIMHPKILSVSANDPLHKALDLFIKEKQHLFIVTDEWGGFQGVISLEDVIEEIIGAEIMDEGDEVPDLRALALEKKKKLQKISPHM